MQTSRALLRSTRLRKTLQMSHSLNSLKKVIYGILYIGDSYRADEGGLSSNDFEDVWSIS